MASIQLNKEEYMKDSIWCSENDFIKLIKNNIMSITKQTKYIPIELLVVDPLQYLSIYNEYSTKINEVKDNLEDKKTLENIIKLNSLYQEQKLCHMKLLNDAGKEIFKKGLVSVTKRGAVPPVSCNISLPPINTWVAPHDIKDYGDTDESIYRNFFKFGYVRIELALPDTKTKEILKKVYYIPDPNALEHKYVNEYITVSEAVYRSIYKIAVLLFYIWYII